MTSASRYVTSVSRYLRKSSIYIRGLIPRNFNLSLPAQRMGKMADHYAEFSLSLSTYLPPIVHTKTVDHVIDPIVGEPKWRILQKHTFFAPERYTVGILYTDSLNSV